MKLKIKLISYGLKSNAGAAKDGWRSIPTADLYLDCRGVVEKGLVGAAGGGANPMFMAGVEKGSPTTITSFQRMIEDSLPQIVTRRNEEPDPYAKPYVICFLCAHQRRPLKNYNIYKKLKMSGYVVEVS